jgi:vancomycin aglycone glucosyltransferase
MKFVLASYGSRGDVEPFAAVARELLRRGHDVLLAVPPHKLGLVESAGLAAVVYGPDSQALPDEDFGRNPWKTQNPLNAVGEVIQHVTRVWAELGPTLMSLANGADLLMTGTSDQGIAAEVAEHYGIPRAVLHFFPPGVSASDQEGGPLEIQAYDELCFPGLAAEWAAQGCRRPFSGALTLELPTDADDEVLSWIAAGTPPIYFGFGSSVRVASAADTVAVISAACAQLGERALICSGASDFTDIPHFDHVKVVGEMNHAAILPACRAVVHHGGAGTTAAGLRAGLPTLILWLWLDQPIWAAAVERLKVGFGRPFSTTTRETLVGDLRSILTRQYVTRAQEVASRMTTPAESAASAADLLETSARRR